MKKNIYPKTTSLQKIKPNESFIEHCGCLSVTASPYANKKPPYFKRKLNTCGDHYWAEFTFFKIEDEEVIIL